MSLRTTKQTVLELEQVSRKDKKLITKKITKKLYTWEEIPDWQKDNEHILKGYVKETRNFKDCIESLFFLHNETVNIYSHFIPGVCFLFTIFLNRYCVKQFLTTTIIDYFFINLFFFGAFTCLILSSIFHCFKSHSLEIAVFGNKLDYIGIVVLIVSSMISILYYVFYDDLFLFNFFASLTLILGTVCGIVSSKDIFRSREWRPYRAALFVIFGLSAILPIVTGIFYYGFAEAWKKVQLSWVILEGIFYIFGAFLYGIRFPEKLHPGKYDFWGHSHQLFHVFVVIAALCHLRGLLGSYELVHERLLAKL